MPTTGAHTPETRAAILELDVQIDAPPDEVWQAVTDETDAWWIAELRCVAGDSRVTLEPHAGGRMFEENAAGGSLLWFTVIAVEPGASLNLAGHMAPPFGGPATAYLLLRVEAHDGGTRVSLTNSMHGVVDEATLASTEAGWRMLLENGLKRHVESRGRK